MIINYIDVNLRLPSKIRVILEIKILCIEITSNFSRSFLLKTQDI